jgi:hypothetical protein
MNEKYLTERRAEAEAIYTEARAIGAAMGWTVEIPAEVEGNFPVPHAYLCSGDLEIMVWVPWNDTGKLEFSPAKWPEYTDQDGQKRRVVPRVSIETKATRTRTPEAIGKGVLSRLVPEYTLIYATMVKEAAGNQAYADREITAKNAMFEACQEVARAGGKPYFVRNLPGSTVTVEWRGASSVKIDLRADEMVSVIGFLRELRAETVES